MHHLNAPWHAATGKGNYHCNAHFLFWTSVLQSNVKITLATVQTWVIFLYQSKYLISQTLGKGGEDVLLTWEESAFQWVWMWGKQKLLMLPEFPVPQPSLDFKRMVPKRNYPVSEVGNHKSSQPHGVGKAYWTRYQPHGPLKLSV